MGREGFLVRDRSTSFYQDEKVLRAVMRAGPLVTVAFDALADASWRCGSRLTLEEALAALPRAYVLGDELELARVLEGEGLVDAEHRITSEGWEAWYAPAAARAEAARAAGREGARRRWGEPNRLPIREPIREPNARPSVRPSDRPTARATPQEAGEVLRSLSELTGLDPAWRRGNGAT